MHNKLILGTRKGLIILEKKGSNWHLIHETFAGIPVSYAAADPRHKTIWVCADHGHWGQKLYASHDGGATLTEIAAPRYPEEAVIYDVWQDGAETPAKVTYLWTITPGGPDQPNRLYIGTEPGGLFQTDDGGETFELVDSLWQHPSRKKNWFGGGRDQAGACSIVVDPRDSDHIYVGVSIGGVYESTDGGKTWNGRNAGLIAEYLPDPHAEYGHDPHCLVASPSNPDVLWQQNHCGVFRSTDRGQNWQNISQPDGIVKFGFPIVVDPHDENTAWIVPAVSDEKRMAFNGALCVCRTNDGGQTWQEQRQGLPQKHAYDVVFRHALDINEQSLAFGSTSGNLYLSDDKGDNWQTIGTNFPPIYSVRFA